MPRFGDWTYTADREATVRAYSEAEGGWTERCGCAPCRNFRLVRARVLPDDFLELLDALGIDPAKEAEVYHNARLAAGRHDYGGWYHFVGTLAATGDIAPMVLAPGFSAWMCRAAAPRLPSLKGLAAVQLEFHCEAVPWLLDEPEPL
jgi:hypothetical protein